MPTITVDVELEDFDDSDILEECRSRGLNVLPTAAADAPAAQSGTRSASRKALRVVLATVARSAQSSPTASSYTARAAQMRGLVITRPSGTS